MEKNIKQPLFREHGMADERTVGLITTRTGLTSGAKSKFILNQHMNTTSLALGLKSLSYV